MKYYSCHRSRADRGNPSFPLSVVAPALLRLLAEYCRAIAYLIPFTLPTQVKIGVFHALWISSCSVTI
jgi:hypothetical protein